MATLPLGESLDISLKTQSRHFINPQIKKIDDCYCLFCPVRLLCISRASYAARSAGQEAAFGLLYPSTQMGIDSSRFQHKSASLAFAKQPELPAHHFTRYSSDCSHSHPKHPSQDSSVSPVQPLHRYRQCPAGHQPVPKAQKPSPYPPGNP